MGKKLNSKFHSYYTKIYKTEGPLVKVGKYGFLVG